MFDETNPPETYLEFKRALKKSVESVELSDNEGFETALFLVSRRKHTPGKVVFAYELFEESDKTLDPDDILFSIFPNLVRSYESKFFGIVLPANQHNPSLGESKNILILMTGDLNNLDISLCEVIEENDYYYLDTWEKANTEQLEDLAMLYRRSIVLQG